MAKKTRAKKELIFSKYTPLVRSGSRSNNRFSFQESWSLGRIIDIHDITSDYLAAFDFHEDFVLFTDCKNLSTAQFFQIKTNEKSHWKLTELTGKSAKKRSFLDKLADNFTNLPNTKIEAYIVLNGNISLTNPPGSVQNGVYLSNLDSADLKTIENKTIIGGNKKQFAIFLKSSLLMTSSFPLSEIDREIQIRGMLSALLDKIFPNRTYKIGPIFQCLQAEVSRRSKFEKPILNQAELRKHKAISKDQFAKFLADGVQTTETSELAGINQRLNSEGASLLFMGKIKAGYNEMLPLIQGQSPTLEGIAKKIRTEIENELGRQSKLTDLIDAVFNSIKGIPFADGFQDNVLKALIAYEYQKKG